MSSTLELQEVVNHQDDPIEEAPLESPIHAETNLGDMPEVTHPEGTLTAVQDGSQLPDLDSSPVANSLGSANYIGTSPDIDGSRFDFNTAVRVRDRRILGNSASGKCLHPRGNKKQEMPKSVFSSVIALPKIKQQQSHRLIAEQYKAEQPKTFQLPSYRGYVADRLSHPSPQQPLKKKIYDVMDSRYRPRMALDEGLRLTWALTKRVERQNGNKKLEIRDLDHPKIHINRKTEDDYIKVCVDVSADEEAYDQEEKDLIGKNAVKEYNQHYRLLNKIESENEARKVKNSMYTNILAGIRKQKLMPMKMDVIKTCGNAQIINNK